MKYGSVPGIEKPVSRLVQGTAEGFDPAADLDAAFRILDTAYEHGFTTFDTAHIYGSERSIGFGKWLKSRNVRDKVVILAKGAHHSGDVQRVTPEEIESDINDTLGWMDVDNLDLFVLHRDDPNVPVGPIVEALNAQYKEGKITAFGGSNWTHRRIDEANRYAAQNGLIPFVVSSPNFSLAEQVQEPWLNCVSISGPKGGDAREYYQQHQIAVFCWSSLAAGFFSGRFRRDNLSSFTNHDELTVKCYAYEQNFQRLDRAQELARKLGVTLPQIALAYVMNQPMNIFALTFCANEEQFIANNAALDLTLSPQELAWLDLRADSPE